MVSKSKFLEDIYSNDCQLVVKLPKMEQKHHAESVAVMRTLRGHFGQLEQSSPKWL